jgi:DNA-binding XRE family transcriptional regulator
VKAFLEKDQQSLANGADKAGGAGVAGTGPDLALFGQRLRHARKARGLTLAELGAKVGRAPSVLSLLENGRREPKLSLIEALAQALSVPTAELLRVQMGRGWCMVFL